MFNDWDTDQLYGGAAAAHNNHPQFNPHPAYQHNLQHDQDQPQSWFTTPGLSDHTALAGPNQYIHHYHHDQTAVSFPAPHVGWHGGHPNQLLQG
jgi:hypothetical protein